MVVVEEDLLFLAIHLEEEGALSALHLRYIKICRAISNNFGVIPLLGCIPRFSKITGKEIAVTMDRVFKNVDTLEL